MTVFVWVAFIASLLPGSQSLRIEADGLISDTIQPETGPIIRNGVGTVSIEHVPFGCSQGIRGGASIGQMSVEALHQIECRGVVNAPKRRNYGLRTCELKREREIGYAFFALQTAGRGIAGRQNDQVGIRMEVNDLACL